MPSVNINGYNYNDNGDLTTDRRKFEATYLDSVYQKYGSDSSQYSSAEAKVRSGSIWNNRNKLLKQWNKKKTDSGAKSGKKRSNKGK